MPIRFPRSRIDINGAENAPKTRTNTNLASTFLFFDPQIIGSKVKEAMRIRKKMIVGL
jgi:hypothetical protein